MAVYAPIPYDALATLFIEYSNRQNKELMVEIERLNTAIDNALFSLSSDAPAEFNSATAILMNVRSK